MFALKFQIVYIYAVAFTTPYTYGSPPLSRDRPLVVTPGPVPLPLGVAYPLPLPAVDPVPLTNSTTSP